MSIADGQDVTANLILPEDPAERSVYIEQTALTPAFEVSNIPTVTLPLTTAQKAHIAGIIAAISGAGQVAIQLLPDGGIKEYVAAGVGVVTVIAIWLGVYTVPNVPKIIRK